MMMRRLSVPTLGLLGALAAASAGAQPPDAGADADAAAAPLDPEIAALPHARARWLADAVYGGRVYVLEAGPARVGAATAPPLVLVHGLGDAGVRDFYPVLPALSETRRVVTFDLPGFGRSGRENLEYTPASYAAVLAEVIAGLGPGPVDVVGHSMGGAIALLHAGTHPEQVRRLVAVDAAGILHREALMSLQMRRATDPASRYFPTLTDLAKGAADRFVDETRRFGGIAPKVIMGVPALRKRFLAGDPDRIAALGLILQNFGEALSAIRAPTLLVWGGDDHVAPLRTGRLLADRVSGATLVVLPGVGHDVMAEAPGKLVAEIEKHVGPTGPSVSRPPSRGASHGALVCKEKVDVAYSGVYDSITLDGCANVSLDGVRAKRLVMRHSSASAVGSDFADGVVADDSQLFMTGGRVGGDVGLTLDGGSRLDLAGVAIEARRRPYQIAGGSRILFSVCPITRGARVRHMHGFCSDDRDETAK